MTRSYDEIAYSLAKHQGWRRKLGLPPATEYKLGPDEYEVVKNEVGEPPVLFDMQITTVQFDDAPAAASAGDDDDFIYGDYGGTFCAHLMGRWY